MTLLGVGVVVGMMVLVVVLVVMVVGKAMVFLF